MSATEREPRIRRCALFPDDIDDEIASSEHLVAEQFEIVRFVVVYADPQRTILPQKPANDLQPVAHRSKPDRMLQSVVVVREGTSGVVRRINEAALHLIGESELQRLQREQVVAEDQDVVRTSRSRNAIG